MKRLLALLLTTLLLTGIHAQEAEPVGGNYDKVDVQGTEMAQLPYALDVMKHIPRVQVTDGAIRVTGRGDAAIYINRRKVTDLAELSRLAASKVKAISLLYQPGAEYGKDVQAVIVVHTISETSEGLTVDENLRLDLTDKLATNNELGIGWKHKALTLDGFFAFNEEKRTTEKFDFKRYYKDLQLQNQEITLKHPEVFKQRFTGQLNASYDFNARHRLAMSYSLMRLHKNRTYTPETLENDHEPETRHDVSLEYTGHFGAWQLNVGNNTYFDNIQDRTYKPADTDCYLRDEANSRTYAIAKAPLWNGHIQAGAEHDYGFMDVDKHDEDVPIHVLNANPYLNVHATHPEHTLAAFASISQKLGRWDLEGGLRYEHLRSVYRPCNDDGLMMGLRKLYEAGLINPDHLGQLYIARMLLVEGQAAMHRDFLYPTLRIATQQGLSQFSLTHTQSSVRPYLALTRLSLSDVEHMEDQILYTERIMTTALAWKYKWLALTATHTHYSDPICSTTSGSVSYNAPGYEAFDLNAAIAPHIGIWAPQLNANMHKQWFEMPLANGSDKLDRILFGIKWDNTITLPSHWMIMVDASWNSKGANRNYFFYRPDFCLNASVHKELPRLGLTFILDATNITRHSYDDTTRYTQAYKQISEGLRERKPRMVSLTVRYRMKR